MVVPHKDNEENKLDTDYWSIREITVTTKTKLQAGH